MVTLPPFKFIAGTLCLDFVNTVGDRSDGRVLVDKLVDFKELVRWGEVVKRSGASVD